ncbi:two-component system C4-dicarboxylate transport sensor histidine kinase DctB [Inquilinus ginsengisoli]|uniref:histidine kinase n=1 Tax=Inquilinus ginsengisoli TaxID=363840 RepID=A0ABU1JJF0_9PROT|nr:ATP-binding protein [Inquilinus ginsengisoli]MDR6288737.1 two-component system C4-dicarboxylate transport sensor histidine kinase DctB [Inquilinus ginsengisoli]
MTTTANPDIATPRPAPAGRPGIAAPVRVRRDWAVFALIGLALFTAVTWLAGPVGRDRALGDIARSAEAALGLHVAMLRSELEKQRSLPFVLAQDPDVRAALGAANDRQRLDGINAKFEALSQGTRTAVIYLLDRSGTAIAASNWREPISFVGQHYAFRAYYLQAVDAGAAEFFAMGTMSRRPGVYLSRRIDGPNGLLGVIVVKVEFDAMEEAWGRFAETAFVTDERGVVLLTDVPEWRFRSLGPLPESDRAAVRESLQYGAAPLEPLPIAPDADAGRPDAVVATLPDTRGPAPFLAVAAAVPSTGWTLHLLAPTMPAAGRAAFDTRLIAGLVTLLALAGVAALLYRRHRALGHAARQAAAQAELERRVAERTHALNDANQRLTGEIDERRRVELVRQQLQEELAQANRLAILGQVAASVAHEINQPVAAIRSYADNAAVFLDREKPAAVRDNLAIIAGLTDRVGAITQHLRAFSRKAANRIEAISCAAAIEGALILTRPRLRRQSVRLAQDLPPADVRVVAERVRLEQILVNLLQNALDAVDGLPEAEIRIAVNVEGDRVRIAVSDTGKGLDPATMKALFIPFATSKPAGLGLGLVICQDIAREFGGAIAADNRAEGGAVFTVTLKRAP